MRRRALATIAMLLLLSGTLVPRLAAAEEASPAAPTNLVPAAPPPAPPDAGPPRWYGWQGLGCDLVALAFVSAGAALENTPANDPYEKGLIAAGAGVYLLGGPLVHQLNGNTVAGSKSLALRLGLPLLGAGAGYVLGSGAPGDDGPSIQLGLALIGAASGGVVAVLIDDLVLGRDHPRAHGSTWSPAVSPSRSGAMTFGVVGMW
jgi:hypothetical protein